jgi:hypothetical protein
MKDETVNRLTGLTGAAGALLFFAGDMLFYGHWGSGAKFHDGMLQVLREGSWQRLFVGGLVGPIAACLCLIGCWHVRRNVISRSPFLGRVAFFALAATMVIGSAVHARWEKFLGDQEWIKIKKETGEINGPLVGEIQDRSLYLTDYSPRKALAK